MRDELGRLNVRLAGEQSERDRFGADSIGDVEVELGAVAGRDRRGLEDLIALDQIAEHPHGAPLGQRHALAHLQRSRLV